MIEVESTERTVKFANVPAATADTAGASGDDDDDELEEQVTFLPAKKEQVSHRHEFTSHSPVLPLGFRG